MPLPELNDAVDSDIYISSGSQHPKFKDAAVLTILPETRDLLPLKGQDLPPIPRIEVSDWNAFFDPDYASCSVWPISGAVNLPEHNKFDEEIKKTHPELNDAMDRISAGGGVKIQQSELKDADSFLVSSLQISNFAKTKRPELNNAAVFTILPETQDRLPLKAKDLPPRIEDPDWNAFFDKVYVSFGGWPISDAMKEGLKEAFNEEIKKMHPQLNDVMDSDIHISAGSGAKIHHPELKNAMLVSNLQINSLAKIKNPELNDADVLTILPETQDRLPLHQEDFPPIHRVEVAKDIDWASFLDHDYASGGVWSSFGAVKEEANAEDNKSDEEAKKDA